LVLERAKRPAEPTSALARHANSLSDQFVPATARQAEHASAQALPAWLVQARRSDAVAPWNVDTQGHVHFKRMGLAR
jgi:hypothetical protein